MIARRFSCCLPLERGPLKRQKKSICLPKVCPHISYVIKVGKYVNKTIVGTSGSFFGNVKNCHNKQLRLLQVCFYVKHVSKDKVDIYG